MATGNLPDLGHVLAVIGILIGLWAVPDERLPPWLRRFSNAPAVLMGIFCCLVLLLWGFPRIPPGVDDSASVATLEESDPTVVTRERKFEYGQTNDHCSGPRSVRWHVPAAEGWKIDVDSIQAISTVKSEKSDFRGVTKKAEDGFDIEGRIVNRGNCVYLFGARVAKDARGALRVRATYTETRVNSS